MRAEQPCDERPPSWDSGRMGQGDNGSLTGCVNAIQGRGDLPPRPFMSVGAGENGAKFRFWCMRAPSSVLSPHFSPSAMPIWLFAASLCAQYAAKMNAVAPKTEFRATFACASLRLGDSAGSGGSLCHRSNTARCFPLHRNPCSGAILQKISMARKNFS